MNKLILTKHELAAILASLASMADVLQDGEMAELATETRLKLRFFIFNQRNINFEMEITDE